MIDQAQRINTLVKDELTKAAVSFGIDKSMVGFSVTQSFAPIAAPNGETGLFYTWVVTATLRVPLLGYPDIAIPVLLPSPPGTLPPDEGFRGSARSSLDEANKVYRKLMEDSETAVKGLGKYAA